MDSASAGHDAVGQETSYARLHCEPCNRHPLQERESNMLRAIPLLLLFSQLVLGSSIVWAQPTIQDCYVMENGRPRLIGTICFEKGDTVHESHIRERCNSAVPACIKRGTSCFADSCSSNCGQVAGQCVSYDGWDYSKAMADRKRKGLPDPVMPY